jgi:hypothetical protein
MRSLPFIAVAIAGVVTACARPVRTAPAPACAAHGDVCRAIAARVAGLKERGGECETYAGVLERSLATGQLVVRPYMWRVGGNLASAQATPAGEITVAREVDSLNVGVRTLDDVLWSAEHEAVHVAFRIPSGEPADEAVVDRVVRDCRPVRMSRTGR